jgi:uncharacterized membrane protein
MSKENKQLLGVLIAFIALVVIFIGMVILYQNSQVESQYGRGFAEKAALRRQSQRENDDQDSSSHNASEIQKYRGRNYDTY